MLSFVYLTLEAGAEQLILFVTVVPNKCVFASRRSSSLHIYSLRDNFKKLYSYKSKINTVKE